MKHRLFKTLVVITFFTFMTTYPMDTGKNKLFLTRTKKLLAYLGAFPIACTASTCAHELGHAAVATAFCPGIVRKINIGVLSGSIIPNTKLFNQMQTKWPVRFSSIYKASP